MNRQNIWFLLFICIIYPPYYRETKFLRVEMEGLEEL